MRWLSQSAGFSIVCLMFVLMMLGAPTNAPAQMPGMAPAADAESEEATDAVPPEEEVAKEPEALTTGEPTVETEILALRLLPLTAGELAVEAEAWQGLLRYSNKQIADATIRLRGLEGDQAEKVRFEVAEMSADRDQIARNYLTTIANWEKKGGSPDEVAAYRQYHTAIFTEELRVTDFQTLAVKALAWVTDEEGGIKVAYRIAVIIGSFLGLLVVARLIRGIAGRAFRRIPKLTVVAAGLPGWRHLLAHPGVRPYGGAAVPGHRHHAALRTGRRCRLRARLCHARHPL